MRVGIERGAPWAATTPAMQLKNGSVFTAAPFLNRTYDLSPDGQRVPLGQTSGLERPAAAARRSAALRRDAEAPRADEVGSSSFSFHFRLRLPTFRPVP